MFKLIKQFQFGKCSLFEVLITENSNKAKGTTLLEI